MEDGQDGNRRDPTNGQSLDAPTVRLAPVSGRARPWRRPLKITLITLGALAGLLFVLAISLALADPEPVPTAAPATSTSTASPATTPPPPAAPVAPPPPVAAPPPPPTAPPAAAAAPPAGPAPAAPATAPPRLGSVCAEFETFFNDITANTPRSPTLGPEADRVAQAGQHSSARLRTVSDDLNVDVHRPEFPTEGNAFDPPIQTLYDDCY